MNKCKDCVWADLNNLICRRLETRLNPDENKCGYFSSQNNIGQCDCCGNMILINKAIVSIEENKTILFCHQCAQKAGTCQTCIEKNNCDFQTNPINLPKQIQQTIQRGPAVMSTTIINPDRVNETCKKNCECFSEEYGCLKQNGTCGGYQKCFI